MASPLNGWNVVKMMLDEFDLSRRNESQITPQEVQLKDHLLRKLIIEGPGWDPIESQVPLKPVMSGDEIGV